MGPSEGSRLARTGAAMLNIFRKPSQSPRKEDIAQPIAHVGGGMASRATGTFGGYIVSNMLDYGSFASPQPKM